MKTSHVKHLLAIALVYFLAPAFVAANHTQEITISPACNSQFSCMTLWDSFIPHSSNLSLILLPGVHRLARHLIENSANFSLVGTPGRTIINCTTNSDNLNLHRISEILIMGIIFQNCNLGTKGNNLTWATEHSYYRNRISEFQC